MSTPASDLPSLPDYDDVPVNNSVNAGRNSAVEQGRNIPMGWKPTAAEPVPVIRCVAPLRNGPKKGEQCPNWSLRGATVCISHGGRLPNVRKHAEEVREAARMRILGLSDMAIDTLEELADAQGTAGAAVRLKAATELLDRAGIKGGIEMNVTHEVRSNPSEEIAKRLAGIAKRLGPKEIEPEDLGETVVEEPEGIKTAVESE